MLMKSKVIFAVLLAAMTISAVFVLSRTANAAALNPETAVVAQSADTLDSSRLGGARAGIGRPGIGRPGIGIGRPGIGRPGIGVRPPIARPPIVRPIVPIVNEINVVDEEEVNIVVCDEELLLFLEECIVD